MKRLLAGLAAPALVLSLATACSDGGADETADADASATPTEAESDSADSGDPTDAPESGDAEEDAAADAPGADSRYCELLSTDFATLFASIQGPEDVKEAIDIIGQIADEAPEEVADEWAVMGGALDSMQGALTRAAELQEKAAAGEVTPEQLQKQTAELMKDMEALNTPENNQAGDAVAKHAADYCGLQLG
ncbi:MAG TPA: hypothetical protein VJ819_12320 [Nocardioidaceae bacterium]|jgi:hypothetical protein|nr:hypothetical protein [Nocardioidaceae bacterium]